MHKEDIQRIDCLGDVLISAGTKGQLKQWSVQYRMLVKDYGLPFDHSIECLAMHRGYFFAGSGHGRLKMWDRARMELAYDFGVVHYSAIYSIHCSEAGAHVFTTDLNGEVKKFNIHRRELVKDYGKLTGSISIMKHYNPFSKPKSDFFSPRTTRSELFSPRTNIEESKETDGPVISREDGTN